MNRARPGYPRLLVAAGTTLALVLTPVGLASATAPAAPLTVAPAAIGFVSFTAGTDGRIYRSSLGTPVQAVSGVVTTPGAVVSAVPRSGGNVAIFSIGQSGGLISGVSPSPTGAPGLSFFADGPGNLAPPGGQVSAANVGNTVHVFFPGRDGAVYGTSYTNVRPGSPPRRITPTGLVPPGAVLAAAVQPDGRPGAVFVDTDGVVGSVWRTPEGTWVTVAAGSPNGAPAGGGVAAVTTDDGVAMFFTGQDGRLWRTGFAAGPQPVPWTPVAISQVGAVPVGARLAATRLADGSLTVFFAGTDGAVRLASNLGGDWLEPAATTAAGVVRPGGPLSLAGSGDWVYVAWCGNDVWWWLRWRWPRPPPPPPWYGDLFEIPTTSPLWQGATPSTIFI